jgi:hypothetical protein
MATLTAHPGSTEESQQSASHVASIEPTAVEIYDCIRNVEKRTWWSFFNTVVVVLLLTATIVCLTLPTLVRVNIMHPFGGADLDLAVQGLVALVLLFNIFAARQHMQLRKLCERIKESLRAVGK